MPVETYFELSNPCLVLLECLLLFSKACLEHHCLGLGFVADARNFGCRGGLGLGVERLQLGNTFLEPSYLPYSTS